MKRQDSSSQKILKALTEDIRRGRYAVGHAFPSETTLARRFAVSRTLMATIVGELSRLARANGYELNFAEVYSASHDERVRQVRDLAASRAPGVTFADFRGFRGNYRIGWTCAACGGRHTREVYLMGDGLREAARAAQDFCPGFVRRYTVDGKAVTLPPDEEFLDLGKIYPKGQGHRARRSVRRRAAA